MFDKIINYKLLREAGDRLSGPRSRVAIGGLWGAAPAFVAAALGRLTGRPVLYIVRHDDDSDEAAEDIALLDATEPGYIAVRQFPAWESRPGVDRPNPEITARRLQILNLLADDDRKSTARAGQRTDCIIASVVALLQPVPAPGALASRCCRLEQGGEYPPEQLAAWLVDHDYDAVEQVDVPGEYARRGGIVDVFFPVRSGAVRIEYFGDTIESMRLLDPDTQRSTGEISSCVIPSLSAGGAAGGTLLDYLPDRAMICALDTEQLRELAAEIYNRASFNAEKRDAPAGLLDAADLFSAMQRFRRADMHYFSEQSDDEIDLGIRSLEFLSLETERALGELEHLASRCAVWIACANEAERERFRQLTHQKYPALAAGARLVRGHLSKGFHWPGIQAAAVGHHEIYKRYSRFRRAQRIRPGRPVRSFVDLDKGDYVVHVSHGIAKYEGLGRLDRDGVTEEYLKLRFRNNAVLHVPAARIGLVQKYVGPSGRRPSLSALGGRHWARTRRKVGEAVEDMAAELLRVQAARRASPGRAFPADTEIQRQFADEFPYTETPDQIEAVGQIARDMAAARPMDRLVCGDVGYGKTELAMRAAMSAAEEGAQTAVLVPTTLLAEQHCRTFSERFADYPVRVEMLSRLRTPAQQKAVIDRLATGVVDVVIGTHRLLSGDVRFPDLGLVVIDEEQRFGVAAKEYLKTLRASVDVMTLTATPIPRTLHMAMLGLRDITALQTPPIDRQAIRTEVVPEDDGLIRTAIAGERNRGGQVFFLHNRVMGIQQVADRVRRLAGGGTVAVAHGRMPRAALEDVMIRFVAGTIDVLVCTTIIESGLDIPAANTLIVRDADRFGLAELHQLRGRIGRYKHRAYCYLLLPKTRGLSMAAARRLKAIEECSELGAGFRIAMRDLEIRGAGNILGPQQSGHIAAVGYEMYCSLLEEASCRLRGEEPPRRVRVHLELGLEAYIPVDYISSDRQRMEYYRRIGACCTPGEVADLREDIADACGSLPARVSRLLETAELRVRLSEIEVESAVFNDPDIVFSTRDAGRLRDVFAVLDGSLRCPGEGTIHWRPPEEQRRPAVLLELLLGTLRKKS